MKFLISEWTEKDCFNLLENFTLYVTHGEKCGKFVSINGKMESQDVPELKTNQEEADTHMFLHANHAAPEGYQTVVIKFSDVDVEVLACYLQSEISSKLII